MLRKFHKSLLFMQLFVALLSLGREFHHAEAQERRTKVRISNAGFTITALPLLAAKDWGLFSANGLDMEVILMQSSLVPAALTQGDIDFRLASARHPSMPP